MTIFFCQDRSVPLLHASVALPVGTLSDPLGKEGATRLMLRMLRRSVGGRTAEECEDVLDSLGAVLSGEAAPSVASLHATVIKRSSAEFLSFFREALLSPGFSEAEFEKVKREALAEHIESLDSDSGLVRRFFSERFFRGHPYAKSGSGTPSSLKALTLSDVEAQYALMVKSGGLAFAFSGDAEAEVLADFVRSIDEASPTVPQSFNWPEDPAGPKGRHLLFVDKPERTQTQILMGCLGTVPTDEDHFALHVGHTIFGGTFTGRLSQEVRGKRGWSYGAYSSLGVDRRRQSFTLWTFPKSSDAGPCISLEINLLKSLIDKGVSAREVSAAKKYLTRSHAFSIDTASKRMSQLLDAHTYQLPPRYHEDYLERVAALTVNDINEAISRRLSVSDLLVTVVGTQSDLLEQIKTAIPDLASTEVVPFDHAD